MADHVFDSASRDEMDVFNQMGNIGSEVGRALKAKRQGQLDRSLAAFYRGLDLIDETTKVWVSQKKSGVREYSMQEGYLLNR